MIYLIVFFALMLLIVIGIEKKIIASKYLIKRAHKYRHKTRKERVERRKEIEEYKKSLTHKYYLDKGVKDPEIKKMLDKNKYKSLDAFRFEARLFYYGFFISILFGFTFTITGLYKDEFVSSLYPYIQPYFKVFYSNFEKYTFNPLSFKVCFSWIFVFSIFICLITIIYSIFNPKNLIIAFKQIQYNIKIKLFLLSIILINNIIIINFFNKKNIYLWKGLFYGFPFSYSIHFFLITIYIIFFIFFILVLIILMNDIRILLKGRTNAN
ncbi:hypothetical protein [Malaciobacter mytili]|uniref:hypothetical protein n=1 Tax=Malaciobacter mytili TaxID=603050 RepID=UPI003A84B7E5